MALFDRVQGPCKCCSNCNEGIIKGNVEHLVEEVDGAGDARGSVQEGQKVKTPNVSVNRMPPPYPR